MPTVTSVPAEASSSRFQWLPCLCNNCGMHCNCITNSPSVFGRLHVWWVCRRLKFGSIDCVLIVNVMCAVTILICFMFPDGTT